VMYCDFGFAVLEGKPELKFKYLKRRSVCGLYLLARGSVMLNGEYSCIFINLALQQY
jgi:hypothetical protein